MVACHDWDLAEASAAGLSTAFITRPGMSYAHDHLSDLTAADFVDLAGQPEDAARGTTGTSDG